MKIKTIIRQEKIKSWGQLHNAGAHNNRLKQVDNANSDDKFYNKKFIGTNNLSDDVKKIMMNYNIDPKKIRKNAVIANEIIMSLSPEFFSDGILDLNKRFNKENVKAFAKIAKKHIEKKYNGKIAHLSLHLDETTPHFHCVIVPILADEKKGFKLSSRDMFNRLALINMQKDYCNDFNESHLSYEFCYTENSTATHEKLSTHYKEVQKIVEENKVLKEEIVNQKKQINDLIFIIKKLSTFISSFAVDKIKNIDSSVRSFLRKKMNITLEKKASDDIKAEKSYVTYDVKKFFDINEEVEKLKFRKKLQQKMKLTLKPKI